MNATNLMDTGDDDAPTLLNALSNARGMIEGTPAQFSTDAAFLIKLRELGSTTPLEWPEPATAVRLREPCLLLEMAPLVAFFCRDDDLHTAAVEMFRSSPPQLLIPLDVLNDTALLLGSRSEFAVSTLQRFVRVGKLVLAPSLEGYDAILRHVIAGAWPLLGECLSGIRDAIRAPGQRYLYRDGFLAPPPEVHRGKPVCRICKTPNPIS